MRPSQAHFVTSCQQLLVLGAVLAVLTPAASVISLDVVGQAPVPASPGGHQAGSGHAMELTAYTRESRRESILPATPVDAEVTEYALTPAPGVRGRTATPRARAVAGETRGGTAIVSRPQPAEGYAGVGVTWDPAAEADDEALSLEVRTRSQGEWSEWTELEYHDDHAPDPTSAEARQARPGTEVMFVGHVDDVQVRAESTQAPPAGMRLAVIAPGEAAENEREAPALDTAELPSARTTTTAATTGPTQAAAKGANATTLASYTPRPKIYSRAQWGANEKLRDKGSLRYFEVHAGYVHHTVNANGYTRSEVPGILRSIYAYHTQSRGWSDVGYNFLVDRFGRIWEGRYGGVDRPVVGAHTLGYNDWSFAMSAIGNFDIARPSSAMVQAYGALFAWKLSLHGVDASSTRQLVGSRTFKAINGHRDAGSTACPGRYLYAKLPRIRALAAAAQQDWSGRELQSNLAGSAHPDLLVRRASDSRVFVLRTGGLSSLGRAVVSKGLAADSDAVVTSPDLTGDRFGDLLVRRTDGTTLVHPGNGAGGYGASVRTISGLAGLDLLTAVGDVTGDGRNDLVARNPGNGRLFVYPGKGNGGFGTRQRVAGDWSDFRALAATGDLDGDGKPDLLARDSGGSLWAVPGRGSARFGTAVMVAGSWAGWGSISGFGDFNRDGLADLFVRKGSGKPGWIVPSNGDLTFGTALGPITRLEGAGTVVGAAQFAANKLPDVVSRLGADVRTYPNVGTVDLLPAIDTGLALPTADALFNAGDWDRDGFSDLIHRNANGALFLRRGDGKGHFGTRVKLATGFGGVRLLAAVGDMTGDGWPDLMGQPRGSSMRVYPGRGLAGLKASFVAHSAISAGRQVPVGRWNADGAPDSLFRVGSTLSLYPGNGPGGLVGGQRLEADVSAYDWIIGVSDLQVTGHADLIVRARSTGRLYALTGSVKGFGTRRTLGGGMGIYDLAG
ncbi:FG-GAP-like repeat-containing protein [Nocardioides sp.]|uniref:FG-GAP-like repeat-containing protein n=1 Tax=Nocardioides sp. TaxID=35761 RepID=UPI002ECFB421